MYSVKINVAENPAEDIRALFLYKGVEDINFTSDGLRITMHIKSWDGLCCNELKDLRLLYDYDEDFSFVVWRLQSCGETYYSVRIFISSERIMDVGCIKY